VRRYKCTGCGRVWRQDMSKAAEPRGKLSRRGLTWALEGIVVEHPTVSRVAAGLAVSWKTANDAVLADDGGGMWRTSLLPISNFLAVHFLSRH